VYGFAELIPTYRNVQAFIGLFGLQDAITAFYTVITLLNLSAPDALCILGHSFRSGLGALPDALALEDEVIPPELGVLGRSVDGQFIVLSLSKVSPLVQKPLLLVADAYKASDNSCI
jgi:hypothetical protein